MEAMLAIDLGLILSLPKECGLLLTFLPLLPHFCRLLSKCGKLETVTAAIEG